LVLDGVVLTPGTYFLAPGFPVVATIDVPEGWTNCPENPLEQGICAQLGSLAGPARVGLTAVTNVVANPCADLGLDPPVGPSVDDLVAAIRGLSGFQSTDPVDITVDGHPGKEFTVTAPGLAICDLHTWMTDTRTNIVGGGEVNRVRIVDVDGTRVMVGAAWHPGEEDLLPEIQTILDSVRFPAVPAAPTGPTPAATTPPKQGHQSLDDELRLPGRAALAPGFPVAATINVPADWSPCLNTPLEQGVCTPDGVREVMLMYVENVVADPCGEVGLAPPIGPTVDDLVTAIRNLHGFESTDPVDVTVDGHSGKRFTLTAPADAVCNLMTWFNGQRTNGMSAGEINELEVVDVNGTRILIAAARQPGQEDQLPAMLQVFESVQFP